MKAIIPVAGLGTRMLPATKATAKEMLTVLDKPLIEHVVHEAINAGIRDIVLVTQSRKSSIEQHFETDHSLEEHLLSHGKIDLITQVQSICPDYVNIITVRQDEPLGLGHAILCAKPVVGNEDFVVLLPDVLIKESHYQNNLSHMLLNFLTSGVSQILVQAIDIKNVHQYGIADIGGKPLTVGGSAQALNFIEKPKMSETPSNLAIVGRYVFSKNIWPMLEHLTPGAGDEIQLTDAVEKLLLNERVDVFHLDGDSFDCGSKFGLLKANIAYALDHDEYRDQLVDYIESTRTKHAFNSDTVDVNAPTLRSVN